MAERNIFLAYTNAVPGREDEFEAWYEDEHIPDLLAVPGFVSARRYRLHPSQRAGQAPAEYEYLVIYEIEGDVDAIHHHLATTSRRWSDALGADPVAYVFSPVGERREASA